MGKVLEAAGLPNEYNTATFVQYMPIIGPVGCSGNQFKDGVCCVTSCTALKYYTSTTGVVVAIVRRTPSNCDAADESDSASRVMSALPLLALRTCAQTSC
jgi:hypothetical protein